LIKIVVQMSIDYFRDSTKEITKLDKNIFERMNLLIIFKFKEKKSKVDN